MQTKTILTALLGSAAMATVAAGTVYAAGGSARADDDAQALAAVTTAPVSLMQAIDMAEAATQGRTLEAEAEAGNGQVLYEIGTLVDGEVHEVTIDPQTGTILKTEIEPAEADEVPPDGSVEIAAAISAAEAAADGTAIEAEFETEDGLAIYEVEVAGNETLLEVTVDATTGDVLSVETEDD